MKYSVWDGLQERLKDYQLEVVADNKSVSRR
jgi:hypothetical protein